MCIHVQCFRFTVSHSFEFIECYFSATYICRNDQILIEELEWSFSFSGCCTDHTVYVSGVVTVPLLTASLLS